MKFTALKFVYESEELNEKYGDSFDVDGPIRTRGTSTMIIPRTSLYKGKTTCYISINGDKWEAIECHPYSGDDGEWLSPELDTTQEDN